jgi:hypothetical protein
MPFVRRPFPDVSFQIPQNLGLRWNGLTEVAAYATVNSGFEESSSGAKHSERGRCNSCRAARHDLVSDELGGTDRPADPDWSLSFLLGHHLPKISSLRNNRAEDEEVHAAVSRGTRAAGPRFVASWVVGLAPGQRVRGGLPRARRTTRGRKSPSGQAEESACRAGRDAARFIG